MSQVDIEPGAIDTAPNVTTAARPVSLWRERNFVNLWIAETISQFGSQITLVALPLLAVLALDAGPGQMGFLNAAGTAPALLIGLFIGVWVDRLRRRPLMIVADLLRAALLMLVPVAWALGALRIEMLYAVAFLAGTLTVVFDVAWQAFVPSIVPPRQLVDANSKLRISASVAQVGGPGIGGVLVGAITAPFAILVDAISFLLSALFTTRIEDVEAGKPHDQVEHRSFRRDIQEGLSSVFNNAMLRALALSGASLQLCAGVFFAVYILFMTDNLGFGATSVGIILAVGGVGSLAGAALARPLTNRIGEGWAIIAGQFLFGVFGITIPLAVLVPSIALAMLLISEFLQWMMIVISLVNEVSVRQSVTPDRLLGRVAATFQFLKLGPVPVGALLGGVLGEVVGVPATLVIATIGFMLAFLFVLLSPLRGYRSVTGEGNRPE